MLPGPGPVYNNILRMIRERQVIMRAALHFRLTASYIIAVLPSIIIVTIFLMLVSGTYI